MKKDKDSIYRNEDLVIILSDSGKQRNLPLNEKINLEYKQITDNVLPELSKDEKLWSNKIFLKDDFTHKILSKMISFSNEKGGEVLFPIKDLSELKNIEEDDRISDFLDSRDELWENLRKRDLWEQLIERKIGREFNNLFNIEVYTRTKYNKKIRVIGLNVKENNEKRAFTFKDDREYTFSRFGTQTHKTKLIESNSNLEEFMDKKKYIEESIKEIVFPYFFGVREDKSSPNFYYEIWRIFNDNNGIVSNDLKEKLIDSLNFIWETNLFFNQIKKYESKNLPFYSFFNLMLSYLNIFFVKNINESLSSSRKDLNLNSSNLIYYEFYKTKKIFDYKYDSLKYWYNNFENYFDNDKDMELKLNLENIWNLENSKYDEDRKKYITFLRTLIPDSKKEEYSFKEVKKFWENRISFLRIKKNIRIREIFFHYNFEFIHKDEINIKDILRKLWALEHSFNSHNDFYNDYINIINIFVEIVSFFTEDVFTNEQQSSSFYSSRERKIFDDKNVSKFYQNILDIREEIFNFYLKPINKGISRVVKESNLEEEIFKNEVFASLYNFLRILFSKFNGSAFNLYTFFIYNKNSFESEYRRNIFSLVDEYGLWEKSKSDSNLRTFVSLTKIVDFDNELNISNIWNDDFISGVINNLEKSKENFISILNKHMSSAFDNEISLIDREKIYLELIRKLKDTNKKMLQNWSSFFKESQK